MTQKESGQFDWTSLGRRRENGRRNEAGPSRCANTTRTLTERPSTEGVRLMPTILTHPQRHEAGS